VPASRGTETSAEVLVGPPWRMESNAGQQQWYEGGRAVTRSRRRPKGPLRPATALRPLLHPPRGVSNRGCPNSVSLDTECSLPSFLTYLLPELKILLITSPYFRQCRAQLGKYSSVSKLNPFNPQAERSHSYVRCLYRPRPAAQLCRHCALGTSRLEGPGRLRSAEA
jgi:hypothetical protein